MRDGVLSARLTSALPTDATVAGLWPTPTVCGNYNRKGASATSGDGLATAIAMWPTPTASDGTKGGRVTPRKSRDGGTLIEAVSAWNIWPTPTVNDAKNSTLPPSQVHHDNIPGALLRAGQPTGGQLNPTWVEWLMGWPLGWTDLQPLATDRFRSWLQQHGGC